MNRRLLILFGGLLACWLTYWLAVPRNIPATNSPTPVPVDSRALELTEAKAKEEAAYEQQTQARIQELARMESDRLEVSQLEARARDTFLNLQSAKAAVWSVVIHTNWTEYEALREEAAASPSQTTPCTICDGGGTMDFCVLCERSGKCISCKGTGSVNGTQPCPTCRGTGKCYICYGSGRMACPFCDDGTIALSAPPPSMTMRVPGGVNAPSPSRPESDGNQALPAASTATIASAESAQPAPPAPSTAEPPSGISESNINWESIGLSVALFFAGIMAIRKLTPFFADFLNTQFNPLLATEAPVTNKLLHAAAEDPTVAEFFHALRASLTALPALSAAEAANLPSRIGTESPAGDVGVRLDPRQEFLDSAPALLASLRSLLAEVSGAPEEADRLKALRALSGRVGKLKEAARLPALLPVWQVAAALAGLLKQLSSKTSNLTRSTVRTAAGAVDLLEVLCVPDLQPDLATNPPLRLLAVDDDLISRQAISLALKKALPQPALANNGATGLALATERQFDVIFLDVEMPSMDGFELCAKIRESTPNRNTPVVFVTSHSDFNSRTRSTLTGADELIAKPFLSFELTLKALTLALRGRLGLGGENRISKIQNAKSEPVVAGKEDAPVPCPLPASRPAGAAEREVPGGAHAPSDSTSALVGGEDLPAPVGPTPRDFADAMSAQAPRHIAELQQRLQAIQQAPEPAALNDLLGELYVSVHGLTVEAERAEMRAVHKLGFTLESMLKKLLEKPRFCTPSTLSATAAALELLEQLCRDGINPDLSRPPIRLLVVDDDPLARRAVCGALQLVFGRPESAESGEAAVALASRRSFDLIFLDVLMPGMDGFATCGNIRQSTLNPHTPVIFVTSQSDLKSRTQAEASGGCRFIPKPVLASEIMLTALTYILRARMAQSAPDEKPSPPNPVLPTEMRFKREAEPEEKPSHAAFL